MTSSTSLNDNSLAKNDVNDHIVLNFFFQDENEALKLQNQNLHGDLKIVQKRCNYILDSFNIITDETRGKTRF